DVTPVGMHHGYVLVLRIAEVSEERDFRAVGRPIGSDEAWTWSGDSPAVGTIRINQISDAIEAAMFIWRNDESDGLSIGREHGAAVRIPKANRNHSFQLVPIAADCKDAATITFSHVEVAATKNNFGSIRRKARALLHETFLSQQHCLVASI